MMKMSTTAALDAVHTGNALNGAIQTKIANRNTRFETSYQNSHKQKRIIQNFGRSQLQHTRPILWNFQRGHNLEWESGHNWKKATARRPLVPHGTDKLL